jgi:DNA-binding MarR family transcriptional regulator
MKNSIHPEAKMVSSLYFPTSTAFLKLAHDSHIVPKDLTPQQMKIIMELKIAGRLRLSDLSRCAGVTHGTMTVAVQKLLKKGLLVKTKDTQDERAVSLTLTAKGKQISESIEKETEIFFHVICDAIPKVERKKFVECFRFLLKTYQGILTQKGNRK